MIGRSSPNTVYDGSSGCLTQKGHPEGKAKQRCCTGDQPSMGRNSVSITVLSSSDLQSSMDFLERLGSLHPTL
ncbi:hypothetical protein K1719_032738 [Acacia pycnantha]|nr:hypothetical protein K1719_032738 [Acacia pycnantha]